MASLNIPSPSSTVTIRAGSRSRRATAVAATGSGGDTTAPSTQAAAQGRPPAWATTATTAVVATVSPTASSRIGRGALAELPHGGALRGGEQQRRQQDRQDQVRVQRGLRHAGHERDAEPEDGQQHRLRDAQPVAHRRQHDDAHEQGAEQQQLTHGTASFTGADRFPARLATTAASRLLPIAVPAGPSTPGDVKRAGDDGRVDQDGGGPMASARDLLERFRPAGTPGAAAPAGVPYDRGAALEDELRPVLATAVPDRGAVRRPAAGGRTPTPSRSGPTRPSGEPPSWRRPGCGPRTPGPRPPRSLQHRSDEEAAAEVERAAHDRRRGPGAGQAPAARPDGPGPRRHARGDDRPGAGPAAPPPSPLPVPEPDRPGPGPG